MIAEDLDVLQSVLALELETLSSIFIHELDVKQNGESVCVSVQLYPATADKLDEQYVRMSLEFQIPKEYPDTIPVINIRNSRGLSDDKINKISQNLLINCEKKKGSPMLFELIQIAKEELTDANNPSEECAICLYEFLEGDSFMKTECFHYYHCHCLARYFENKLLNKEEKALNADDTVENLPVKVLCPVCRLEICFPDFKQNFPEPIAVLNASISFDDGLSNEMKKFDLLYQKQLAQGGIIDIEAEKQKFLIEISSFVVPNNNAESSQTVSKPAENVNEIESESEVSKPHSNFTSKHHHSNFSKDSHQKLPKHFNSQNEIETAEQNQETYVNNTKKVGKFRDYRYKPSVSDSKFTKSNSFSESDFKANENPAEKNDLNRKNTSDQKDLNRNGTFHSNKTGYSDSRNRFQYSNRNSMPRTNKFNSKENFNKFNYNYRNKRDTNFQNRDDFYAHKNGTSFQPDSSQACYLKNNEAPNISSHYERRIPNRYSNERNFDADNDQRKFRMNAEQSNAKKFNNSRDNYSKGNDRQYHYYSTKPSKGYNNRTNDGKYFQNHNNFHRGNRQHFSNNVETKPNESLDSKSNHTFKNKQFIDKRNVYTKNKVVDFNKSDEEKFVKESDSSSNHNLSVRKETKKEFIPPKNDKLEVKEKEIARKEESSCIRKQASHSKSSFAVDPVPSLPPGFANPSKKVIYGLPTSSLGPPPGFHRS